MGGLTEALKRHQKDFIIAGIYLQSTGDTTMNRKELESKSIKELTDIYNKLVAKNERKATFRDKDKALDAIEAAEKAKDAKPAEKAKAAGKAAANVAKAAGKAAGELKKNSEKAADTSIWTAKQGQFRFNEGSVRKQVYNTLLDNGKGMTQAQIEAALPKVKGIAGALQVLKARSQVSVSA